MNGTRTTTYTREKMTGMFLKPQWTMEALFSATHFFRVRGPYLLSDRNRRRRIDRRRAKFRLP